MHPGRDGRDDAQAETYGVSVESILAMPAHHPGAPKSIHAEAIAGGAVHSSAKGVGDPTRAGGPEGEGLHQPLGPVDQF